MSNPFGVAEHYEADILAYSAQRELRLLVEVKAGQSWAATDLAGWSAEQWHDFFVEQSDSWRPDPVKPSSEPKAWFAEYYFMLATPGQIALWQPGAPGFRQPDYVVDATPVLAQQIDTERFPLARLDSFYFESVVYSWLMFSQFTMADDILADSTQHLLVESGLHEAIFHGDIQKVI